MSEVADTAEIANYFKCMGLYVRAGSETKKGSSL